jgi:serine/threonine protein kinase
MYKYLGTGPSVGIPKVHAFATEGQYNIMLMDLLGPSVEDIFVENSKIMTLKTSLMLGYQMIERIEFLHDKQIIHRDIKPDNFLIGLAPNSHILYIIDFGLSKKYIKEGTRPLTQASTSPTSRASSSREPPGTPASTPTSASSNPAETTSSLSATSSCTCSRAYCPGRT